jgi:hypothetical protein
MVSGGDFTTILTSESGMNLKRTVMVFIHGKTEIVTRVNGTCVLNTEQERIYSSMETLIQVSTKMGNHMAKGNILGRMEQFTLGIFIQV